MARLNVRKRGNKWEYRFEIAKVDGKRKQISKGGFDLKNDCIKAGTEAMNQYNKTGRIFKPSELSLSDYLDYWLEHYVKSELKYNSIKSYLQNINLHIKPIIGNLRLSSIRPKDIQEFLYKLKSDGLKKQSINSIKATLSSALNYAIQPLEYLEYNPCTYAKMPKFEEQAKNKKIITIDEFYQLLKLLENKKPYQLAIMIGFYTGMRIGEVFGLTWDNIDFDNSTITTEKQIIQINKKFYVTTLKNKSSHRTIKINKDLIQYLKEFKLYQKQNEIEYGEFYTDYYFDKSNNEIIPYTRQEINKPIINLIFVRENGKYIFSSTFKIYIHTLNKKYDLLFHFHMLRHTMASLLIENIGETGIKAIQERLGHSSANTTINTYMHSTQKMEDKVVDAIDNFVHHENKTWTKRGHKH